MSEVDVNHYIFIDALAQQAGDVARAAGLPVSIMVAQACYESAYGENKRAAIYNTIFGITKNAGFPPYPTISDLSPVTTGAKPVFQPFVVAKDYKEAVTIWVEYLLKNPVKSRSDSMRRALGDPAKVAKLLPEFAFGPSHATAVEKATYVSTLQAIARRYGLSRFDVP